MLIILEQIYHELEALAQNGEDNGLDILLDAEDFNYASHDSDAVGFKISLHHHADKPMMKYSSQLINAGTKTEINLKPTILYTTDEAISQFSPEDRGCYANGEANLTYLPYKDGYRYEMNNCLIDEEIRTIIWNCRCMPTFCSICRSCNVCKEYLQFIPICCGSKLYCANTKNNSALSKGSLQLL